MFEFDIINPVTVTFLAALAVLCALPGSLPVAIVFARRTRPGRTPLVTGPLGWLFGTAVVWLSWWLGHQALSNATGTPPPLWFALFGYLPAWALAWSWRRRSRRSVR